MVSHRVRVEGLDDPSLATKADKSSPHHGNAVPGPVHPPRRFCVCDVPRLSHVPAWLHSLTEKLLKLGLNDGRGIQGRPANRKPRVSETDQVDEVKRTP